MSNHFSCYLGGIGDNYSYYSLVEPFLGTTGAHCHSYNFFYCAQPNATSASIQGVRTNLREYYVKHLKVDYNVSARDRAGNLKNYIMVFVLNVPQDYVFTSTNPMPLSKLPNHVIPENVLYYNLLKPVYYGNYQFSKSIDIDIKKPFKVSPSYKLVFLLMNFCENEDRNQWDGTAEVFFDVN